jgi:hypothetical protein
VPRSEGRGTAHQFSIGAQIGPVSEPKLSVLGPRLERMFEPRACVADWERTGRVPVPAELLAPPDLTERVAAGPPPVDEITEASFWLARSMVAVVPMVKVVPMVTVLLAPARVAPTPRTGLAWRRGWCWRRC